MRKDQEETTIKNVSESIIEASPAKNRSKQQTSNRTRNSAIKEEKAKPEEEKTAKYTVLDTREEANVSSSKSKVREADKPSAAVERSAKKNKAKPASNKEVT